MYTKWLQNPSVTLGLSCSLKEIFHHGKYKPVSRILKHRNFPGGPMVKTLPSNAGGGDSIPGGAAKPLYLATKKPKHKIEATL